MGLRRTYGLTFELNRFSEVVRYVSMEKTQALLYKNRIRLYLINLCVISETHFLYFLSTCI